MSKKFTMLLLLALTFISARAAYTPVSVTGFNTDIVSNGTGTAASSISSSMTDGFDSAGYALVAQDYSYSTYTPTYYLPTGGSLTSSLTSGLTFQLADYSSNNAVRMRLVGDAGTLTFVTPQSAGSLTILGLSGSGSADISATVNFSDGTSQTFTGINFPDWYSSGGSVLGIGRVSTSDNHTEGTSTQPSLFERSMVLDDSNASKTINSITFSKTSGSGIIGILAVSAEDVCSGTPTVGTIAASATSGCSEFISTLSLSGSDASTGITYQWQSSPDGTTWTSVSGATSNSYSADVTGNIYYRVYAVCTASGASDTATGTLLTITTTTPTVASLPFFEGFENWTSACYSFDRPSTSWMDYPSSGDSSWRRDDQGSDASWHFSSSYMYSPASTEGSHSARFHSGYTHAGLQGGMSAFLDFSASGTKAIAFDYINTSGSDYLVVEVSTDGGATYSTLGTLTTTSGWTPELLTTTATASTAILRFRGVADYGSTDIGIDSLSVSLLTDCSGMPTAGTFTPSVTTGCSAYTSVLTIDTPILMSGISYQWQTSTDSMTWTNVTGATATSYTANVTSSVYYRAYVTCAASSLSDTTAGILLSLVTPVATNATLPFFESFENWIGSCYSYDRPGINWLESPTYGSGAWRRDDQGSDAGWTFPDDYMYDPASTDGSHSARFHSGYAFSGTVGDLDLHIDLSTAGSKLMTFDYINVDGDDYMDVLLSEDGGSTFTNIGHYTTTDGWQSEMISLTSTSSSAIIRFEATSDYEASDIGIDSLYISTLPSCSGMPTAGTFSASMTTGCSAYTSTLSIDTPIYLTGISYQWQSSADGTSWSDIPGATSTTYNAAVSVNTFYRAYVVCSASGESDTTAAQELFYTGPTPVYASVPYTQSFESWTSGCFTYDRPDVSWLTNPSSGDNSWRRDDQGDDASWDHSGFGTYSPASTVGDHSARFHSYYSPSGTVGNMDLYIDLSAAGTKNISFDYNNADGDDYLQVEISEDGGATFTTLNTFYTVSGWQNENVTTTSTSSTAIIRFSATSDYGGSDIGVDNLQIGILTPCSGTPDPGTVAVTQLTGCSEFTSTLSVTTDPSITGITYQWESSTDSITWTDIADATNASYTADVTDTLYIRLIETCTASGMADTTAGTALMVVTPIATYATLPYFQGFENWMGTCYNFDRPDSSWLLSPVTGNDAWRRDDQGSDASWTFSGDGTYSPTSTEGSHSARFHSYEASDGDVGNMDLHVNLSDTGTKGILFDYINVSGTDNLTVYLSEDGGSTFTTLGTFGTTTGWQTEFVTTTSTAATAIIRFSATSDFGYSDIGLDSLSIGVMPPCDTPVALAASNITDSSADINWNSIAGVGGYQYVVDMSAAGPSGPGTATTDTFAHIGGLAGSTTYYVHVRTECTDGDSSAWVTISFTTAVAPCDTPTELTVSGITDTSADFSWSGAGSGYQYVVDMSAGDPTGPGTATTATSAHAGGLTASTTYYVHVRTECADGDSSAWVTVSFTTTATPCDTVMGLMVSSITASSAHFSWSTVAGVGGYEYLVDNSATPSSASGTFTMDTSVTDSALTCGTAYYVHVRTDCSTDTAAWVTVGFTTDSCLGIANLNGNDAFSVTAYPNPVREIVTVSINGIPSGTPALQLTDVTGKLIQTITVDGNKAVIDMSILSPGIYFINYTDSVHKETIKLNKQ